MPSYFNLNRILAREYCGLILQGNYSIGLKKRLAEYISNYRAFEKTGNPAILYISAWKEEENEIWYEYVSKRFTRLFACEPSEVADVFRETIVDRHVYKYMDVDVGIKREIVSRNKLITSRRKLREDVKKMGIIDAVYKISLEDNRVTWLKDLATVETYPNDAICLSLGYLTVVTKEMKAEEERLEKERLQVSLEMAGAICDELNQPLQSISTHSEIVLMHLFEDDPHYEKVRQIVELTKKMGAITKKLMGITKYETKDYVEGVKIVDLEKSSEED